jgi:hypothetical protein
VLMGGVIVWEKFLFLVIPHEYESEGLGWSVECVELVGKGSGRRKKRMEVWKGENVRVLIDEACAVVDLVVDDHVDVLESCQ